MYRRYQSDKVTFLQLLVPDTKTYEVFIQAHSARTGGHLGRTKTFKKIQRSFYWIGYRNQIGSWVKQCTSCAKRKSPAPKFRAELRPFQVGVPLQKVGIDIFGPLPRSKRGNRYILVVTDYFTKWAEAYPLRSQDAQTVARVLVEQFICRYGVPENIHSDQGSNFESEVFRSMCQLLGIHKTRTTPYHPQSDGLAERLNRTIQTMLTFYVSQDQSDWDEHLPYIMMAYRASEQETTGITPNRMMFGRELSLPLNLFVSNPEENYTSPEEYACKLYGRMQQAFHVARNKIQDEQRRQKRLYDIKLKGKPYNVGDKVWLYVYTRKIGLTPKLQSHWKGPFQVVKRISDAVYRIKHLQTGQRKIVHFDKLKPCYVRNSVQDRTLADDAECDRQPVADDRDLEECETDGEQDHSIETSGEAMAAEENGAMSQKSPNLQFHTSRSLQSSGAEDQQAYFGVPTRPTRQRRLPMWMSTGDFVT